jgi:CrcB protein
MNFNHLIWVGLGGMLGSMLRYTAGIIIKSYSFPFSTLTVNFLGSFIIGALFALAMKHSPFHESRLWFFLVTGVCGGFTTFSALSLESFRMLQQERFGTFFLYIGLSILLGLAATFAGYRIFK